MPTLSDNLCTALDQIRETLKADHALDNLKKELEFFVETIKAGKKVELILNETSTRIKSTPSFKEKLARKNYLRDWRLTESSTPTDYEQAIREKLGDLIGTRINCFFKEDEETIYKELIKFLNEKRDIFRLPQNYDKDITKLKSGDRLYKVSCEFTYQSEPHKSCFVEIQVKCLVHNLWGEVEHEISYKAKQYDYNFDKKNSQLKDIYSVLKATQSQLKNLYESYYRDVDLINSLFFSYTHQQVETALLNKNPTRLYTIFFKIFHKQENAIKKYVASKIGGPPYTPVIYSCNEDDTLLNMMTNNILDHYLLGRFDDLKEIFKLLFSSESKLTMSRIISNEMCLNSKSYWTSEDDGNDEEDDYSAEPDLCSEDEEYDSEEFSLLEITEFHHPKEKKMVEYIKDSHLSNIQKNILIRSVDELCKIIEDL